MKIEDFIYESLADQHRTRNLGNGVSLSTVHSVKGLEFDHVFILGGSWPEANGMEKEEERRLFYVGMTRARQTLQLFELESTRNPHTQTLGGDYLVKRCVDVSNKVKNFTKRYHMLGMKDLYLDYAGNFPKDHRIHKTMQRCRVGDELKMVVGEGHIDLIQGDGVKIGRLSNAAKEKWLKRVDSILAIHILAMVRREKDDITDEGFQDKCKCETWEVPLCEIVYR